MPPANPPKTGPFRLLRRLLLAFLLATVVPVVVLRWTPPPASMFMVIAKVSAAVEGRRDFTLHYRWKPWEKLAPAARLAVVAAEDQLFAKHLGFDLKSMRDAFEHNRSGKRIRGASTISQQTAKNLFLYPGRSYFRKILEAYFTALIELFWPKQRVLEVYLNVAQFGRGIYGLGEASRIFFGKPPSALKAREAALLAAVLPNPITLRADRPSPYVLRRQAWILDQMRRLGGTGYLGEL